MNKINGLKFKMIYTAPLTFLVHPIESKKRMNINPNDVLEIVGIWENKKPKPSEVSYMPIAENKKGQQFLINPFNLWKDKVNLVFEKCGLQVGDRLGDDLEFVITSIDKDKITAESTSKTKKMHIEANKLNQILVWEMKEDKTFGNVYYPVVYLEDAYYFEVAMLLMERFKEVKQ